MSHPERLLMERLNALGEGAPNLDEKCGIAAMLRSLPDGSQRLDRVLIGDRDRYHIGLQEAQGNREKLQELLDKMTNPPWRIGVFLRGVTDDGGAATGRAMVHHGGNRHVVFLADGLDADSLALGDEVFLNGELTMLLGRLPQGFFRVGETAVFDRYTADGRLILTFRDDELIADAAGGLQSVKLENGDHVRWDRSAWIAYEKIEGAAAQRCFLDEVPDARPEQVGGQRDTLDALLAALTTTLVAPETAKVYGLGGRCSILLVGPPGCGKTLMARVAAAEIARLTGRKCRFAVVKPSEWENPFVGVTQQNIRNCFRVVREAARDGLAVLFLDEVESVGRVRGSAVGHHSDKFLAALLAELDGFSGRGEEVALISATNRRELVDPALLERISNVELLVKRPDMRGAREIFEIHLPEAMPFSPNGDLAASTRRELAQRAVSRLYSPNAENQLSVIKFRDGKTRTVTAGELMSGRTIEQICRAARQAAFLREVRSKDRGLRVEDIDQAVADAITRLSTLLSPHNVHAYISDLPQDVNVVAVEPVVRRVTHTHRYLNIT